ncbi:histidine phosphatase family protein [Nonomuraea sp. NPDC050556]|uniref:histidine phosphatase family protein n=1 Tax=Nonomuraea sp. NPDC050556 TaxID=3364369 RepID=UPI00379B0470
MRIIAVRHGQSEANLAYQQSIGVPLVYERGDDEVTITPLGERQAASIGAWLGGLPEGEAPEVVWCSPYRRAQDTWTAALAAWGHPPLPVTTDERLRDREWGALAHFNDEAIQHHHPEEWARLQAEGEYTYRPPAGESFLDVAIRLRTFLADLHTAAYGRRVLIVAHDAVVLILRHVIEGTPDGRLADIDAHAPIHNASISTWHSVNGQLALQAFNTTTHLP